MAEGRVTPKYPDLLRKMAEEHEAHLEVSHSLCCGHGIQSLLAYLLGFYIVGSIRQQATRCSHRPSEVYLKIVKRQNVDDVCVRRLGGHHPRLP